MKIAFHSSFTTLRGTEVAMFDYAWHARRLLGHESIVLFPHRDGLEQNPVYQKFSTSFPCFHYRTPAEREEILRREHADFFYAIKIGHDDGVASPTVPTGVHTIFKENAFHGDIYAYVSAWLSDVMSCGKAPWVPHMVDLPAPLGDLRDELHIPRDAVVFGRYGGEDSFDIEWVQQLVAELAPREPRLHFLFMNTPAFTAPRANIHFLPGTPDRVRKSAFIATCDASLHARYRGETFGLAIAEFSCFNKPIFTYEHSVERHHLDVLGSRSFRYRDAAELRRQILSFSPDPNGDWKCFSDLCRPENVIERFRQVYLAPLG